MEERECFWVVDDDDDDALFPSISFLCPPRVGLTNNNKKNKKKKKKKKKTLSLSLSLSLFLRKGVVVQSKEERLLLLAQSFFETKKNE